LKTIRIIPRLDIKGPNLVKGIHLEGLRVLGKPEDFARLYSEQGADELFFQDTVASLYQRNNLTEIITRTAKNTFIPLTVGGGIRSLKDINRVLRAGADKVAINTAAIANPDFIDESSKAFGSSTIIVAIEVLKQTNGSYLAYTDNGREHTDIEVLAWASQVEERGAGEILLSSIDREGTGKGFDIDLVRMVSATVTIPVIAHGGASCKSHIADVIEEGRADAVALASILHYSAISRRGNLTGRYQEEGNVEFLKNNKSHKMFGKENLAEVKNWLSENGITLREIN
jgi:imidazole glycerol-phosphate synthase subunit HisF